MFVRLAAFAALLACATCAPITMFGAIAGDSSDVAAAANSAALLKGFLYANASSTDRVVLVPAGMNFTFFDVTVSNIANVVLQIDGALIISNNLTNTAWLQTGGGAFHILQSQNIEITGEGLIDGQGYWWWWYVILTGKDSRPHMIIMTQCVDVLIHNVRLFNSPQYHILLEDIMNVVVRDLSIYVDVEAQKAMLGSQGLLTADGIPTFPLNTDGIDPSGINVLIDNVTIQNYDDAVAVKPMNGGGLYSKCSSNMTIQNSRVIMGVGMTIGSVPPNTAVNCVENILFQNITFTDAIKAIYVKSNPGTAGSGIVNNITYRDITVEGSLWYPIWIGPQQQQQPGNSGTGCSFLYPIVDVCPTQPLVSITNITLENVAFSGGLTLPGVLLCDPATPCTGFKFINVTNTGPFLIQQSYVCQNVQGFSENVVPATGCF